MQQENRQGRGTSSQASRVAGTPAVVKTYATEVAIEKLTGRSINPEVKASATKWGSLMECVIYKQLGLTTYKLVHKETILHPKKSNIWSGTPDLLAPNKVGEIKCFYIKNFVQLALCLIKKDVKLLKNDFPAIYWQVVSNSIICKKKLAEIIAFIPRRSQLLEIFKMIEDTDFLKIFGLDESDYYFYREENIESFSYMPDDSKMNNLFTFEFEVPMEDKVFLIKKFNEFEVKVDEIYNQMKESVLVA